MSEAGTGGRAGGSFDDRTVAAVAVGSYGALPAGTKLNDAYEIDAPIAAGGMGEVYRGHVIETGDAVAIKVIRADMAQNEAALGLFRKEASALHHLHHDAIVRYFGIAIDRTLQRPYLAMEFVDGVPLSDMIKQGPFSAEKTHLLLRRLATGLQAAHALGVVHRDMSPDNVILPKGKVRRAKIIDFGIAKSSQFGGGTIIGDSFAGKYNYVSPEQLGLHDGVVTAKSDIYSLGLLIAEVLRGRPLDMGGSFVQTIEKRRSVPPLDDVDERFLPILTAMLQPAPDDRPPSMAHIASWELGEDAATMLELAVTDEETEDEDLPLPAPQRPSPTHRTGRNTGRHATGQAGTARPAPPVQQTGQRGGGSKGGLLAAAAVVALLAGGGGYWFLTQHSGQTALTGLPERGGAPVLVPSTEAESAERSTLVVAPPLPRPGMDDGPTLLAEEAKPENSRSAEAERMLEARLEQERQLALRLQEEQARQQEQARQAERARQEERQRAEAAERERLAAEKLAREEAERVRAAAERATAERILQERLAAERALREERERLEREAQIREAQIREAEAREAQRREQEMREAQARARDAQQREAIQRAAQEREQQEQQRQALERAQREADRLAEENRELQRRMEQQARERVAAETMQLAMGPAAGAPPGTTPGTTLGVEERVRRLSTYVRQFDGGPCFYLSPLALGDAKAEIEGYGTETKAFQEFTEDFKLINGFDADVIMRPIAAAQCGITRFLRLIDTGRDPAVRFTLQNYNVRAGQSLNGSIAGAAGRHVEVLLVTDDGRLQTLPTRSNATRGTVDIALRMESDEDRRRPKVLVALLTPKRLQAASFKGVVPADAALDAIADEILADRQTTAVVPVYFRVER
jgi:serine/threonine-protein kinase